MNSSELSKESSGFHVTNPTANDVEALLRLGECAENASDDMIANMFFEIMSDNVSNAEQNSAMV